MPLHFTGFASRREMDHPEEYVPKEAPSFERVLKWDPSQPRDEQGRWSGTGGLHGTAGSVRRGAAFGLSKGTLGEAVKPGGPAYGGPLHGAPGSYRRGPEFGLSKMTLGEALKPGGPASGGGGPKVSLSKNLAGFRTRTQGYYISPEQRAKIPQMNAEELEAARSTSLPNPPPGKTTLEFRPGEMPVKATTLEYTHGVHPPPGKTTLEFRKEPPMSRAERIAREQFELDNPGSNVIGGTKHTGSVTRSGQPTKRSTYS